MSGSLTPSINATALRTQLCGSLRPEHIGQTVTLCGWIARRREHGEHLAFLDVRDYSGVVQCVVSDVKDVRNEWVVHQHPESALPSGLTARCWLVMQKMFFPHPTPTCLCLLLIPLVDCMLQRYATCCETMQLVSIEPLIIEA